MAKWDDVDYGPVMIAAGRYKGTIGYYDDTVGRMAYVYRKRYTTAYVSSLEGVPDSSV